MAQVPLELVDDRAEIGGHLATRVEVVGPEDADDLVASGDGQGRARPRPGLEQDFLVEGPVEERMVGHVGYALSEARAALPRLLNALPSDRERRSIELRFVDGMTQAQIADATGLSQVHISRLLRRSLHLHPSFDPTVLFTAPAAGECLPLYVLTLAVSGDLEHTDSKRCPTRSDSSGSGRL